MISVENINTIDHLRNITKDDWQELNQISHVVKQLIQDHMQIKRAVASFKQSSDQYKESMATLLSDIHRVRRYFYYVIKKIDLVSYLSHEAVDLAIREVRKIYDDDGNILINIQNYLRTFCLKNKVEDQILYEEKQKQWANEILQLKKEQKTAEEETSQHQTKLERLQEDLKATEKRTNNIIRGEMITLNGASKSSKTSFDYRMGKDQAMKDLERVQTLHKQRNELYLGSVARLNSIKKQIEMLEKLRRLELKDQHKKLMVKYGRGLLLYGPPGTGKLKVLPTYVTETNYC